MARKRCVQSLIVIVALIAFALPQESRSRENSASAQSLAQKVVENEIRASENDHSLWSFQDTTQESGRKETRTVIQTKDGNLARLIAINGQPLTPEQQKKEDERIQELLKNSSEQRKQQRDQQKDAQQMTRMLKLLPQALLFSYGTRRDSSTQLLFKPNPQFRPHSHEAQVLNALAGEMWVNCKENRIEEITGHLIHEVKFWEGIAGHLDKGGQFHVKQVQPAPEHWLLSVINVQMNGKALFFKTISVRQIESRTQFHQVSNNLTLAQAAQMLLGSKALALVRGGSPK